MNILIVDDSSDSRLLVKSHLTAAGYIGLVMAASAREAFHLLGMDGVTDVDPVIGLILMDITMPGLDGVEACRRIKATAQLQDIPIIMVTGHHDNENLKLAFAAGANDYITKPLNKVELLARVRSALALHRETDQRKRANAELVEKNHELQQVSLAKTQILSTATHDLKTPLTSIIGYTDRLLLRQAMVGQLNERQQRYVEAISESSHMLRILIDDLLDVSSIEAGELDVAFTNLDVAQQIEAVILGMQTHFEAKRIRVVLDVPSGLCPIYAVAVRFIQVCTNLLSIACKYSPVGATVTITAKEEGEFVQIDVSDTGIGISEADQSKLFTKFFRADNSATRTESGTGLGLFIVKQLIQTHGGVIWVHSEKGIGSTFSFTLPRADVDNAQRNTPIEPNSTVKG